MLRSLHVARLLVGLAAATVLGAGCGSSGDGSHDDASVAPPVRSDGEGGPDGGDAIEAGALSDGTAPSEKPTTIKVVTWNVEDGSFLADGQNFLIEQKPQIAFLQEVDSKDLVDQVVAKLTADQGGTWYSETICRGTDSCASNIAIVSKFPIGNVKQLDLRTAGTYVIGCVSSSEMIWPGRRALGATVTVGGRSVSVFSVRTSSEGAWDCVREEEVAKLEAWASENYPLPHLFGGDFNQQPDDASTLAMVGAPLPNVDAWAQAVTSGGAIPAIAAFDPAPSVDTPTRSSRLDYLFYTKDTPVLALQRAEIVDSGGLSDHRAMEATFDVK